MTLQDILSEKIVLMDGAMGTRIQQFKLQESDYRGEQFADWTTDVKGNNDMLSLTQPKIIEQIHKEYLDVGADIIETNTFNSQAISMQDYQMEEYVYDLNLASAQIAKKLTIEYTQKNSSKPRFVAGALGPTNKTLSISPDVNNLGFRSVTFDQVVEIYYEQLKGLIDGGIDIVLIETIFDTLNAKAAIYAYRKIKKERNLDIPLMVSFTITDASGRTLSGQTVDAFYYSIEYADPLIIGINCALGADQMIPYLRVLNKISKFYVSCYPNAGLPNALGEYDEAPKHTASLIKKMVEERLVNVVGGCCGTMKEHIQEIGAVIQDQSSRVLPL